MNVPTGISALDAIERPNLPPLPPAIRSSATINVSEEANSSTLDAVAPAAVADVPTAELTVVEPLDAVEQAPAATELGVYDATSMFPPTAAEMAAMSDTKAPDKSGDSPSGDKGAKKANLKPKGYAAKRAASILGKVIGVAMLIAVLVAGFLLWNRLKDTALVTQLDEGVCVTEFFTPAQGQFRNDFPVATTDCAMPHAYEVFSVSESVFSDASDALGPNSAYPGIDESFVIGQEFCRAQYDEFVGGDFASSPWQVWTFVPTAERWAEGERRVQCLIGDAAEANLVEGSLRNSGRAE